MLHFSRGSFSGSATIYFSNLFLVCSSVVSRADYMIVPGPFAGLDKVDDVAKLGSVSGLMICLIVLPEHTNYCSLHCSLSSVSKLWLVSNSDAGKMY